jgi:hypothetical protein
MPPVDFTLAQANDLARYFLGPDWKAELTGDPKGDRVLIEGPREILEGDSWRAVFRAAGVHLPLRPQYVAQGVRVMMKDSAICTAISNTFAKRIAAALNNHIPDRRGI